MERQEKSEKNFHKKIKKVSQKDLEKNKKEIVVTKRKESK
jgi:hypothetical protein